MIANSVAMALCKFAGVCILLILFVTGYRSFGAGGVSKMVRIPGDKNPTRPKLTIPQGTLRGVNMITHYNRPVLGFLGIPYARPPVGELRFRAPQPPRSWKGILDASRDSEPCPQFSDEGEIVGDEDCLYHNVFTPQVIIDISTLSDSPSMKFTRCLDLSNNVMVYIIGGGFKTGNNSVIRFHPGYLLDKDVLLVIPNFRVGVFGFLTTGDEVSPGNYGLKDIVRCLQWIQESIRYFGGDPNQVILFGGSTGAMSVHLLALSKTTDGLIHKYITQSGSTLSNACSRRRETCVKQAIKLGKHFGCPTRTSKLLVNCLRRLKVSELLDTRSLFYVWQTFPPNAWNPTTEPDIEGAIFTDTPTNLYAAGKIRDLPWMATVVRDEGITHAIPFNEDRDLFEDFLANIDFAMPVVLDYQDRVRNPTFYTNAFKSYYFNDLNADRELLLANFSKLAGDVLFTYSVYSAFRRHSIFAESRQYFACFSYRGVFSHTYFISGSTKYHGVAHGDELIYLLGHQATRLAPAGVKFSKADWKMVDTMVQLWTSFAKNGAPTTQNSISTTVWEPFSLRNNYLQIGSGSKTRLKMEYNLYPDRMQFWDELLNFD